MPKADVLALAALIGGPTLDATLAERFYHEAIQELGQSPILVTASLLPVTPGTGVFTLPADAIKLMGVLYDDEEITEIARHEAAAVDAQWRDALGTPVAFVIEDMTAKTFRLYPIPEVPSKPFFFLGEPLGTEFPTYAVTVIHTVAPDDLPIWLELPIALIIVAREFIRESNHRDPVFASLVQSTATALMSLV